jgi:hypothetical protein
MKTDAGLCANCEQPLYTNACGWLYHVGSSHPECGSGMGLLALAGHEPKPLGTRAERKPN